MKSKKREVGRNFFIFLELFDLYEKKAYDDLENSLRSKDREGMRLINDKAKEMNKKKQDLEVSYQLTNTLCSLVNEIQCSINSQEEDIMKIENYMMDDKSSMISLSNHTFYTVKKEKQIDMLKLWSYVMLSSIAVLIVCLYFLKTYY